MNVLDQIKTSILKMRREMPNEQAMLVGISGIDASGKGFVSSKLADELAGHLKVAVINADDWLNLPLVRFSETEPGRHFYENALRLDEMFESLIAPLKQNSTVNLTADFLEETSSAFQPHRYFFKDIDIILLEGIFLFKRQYVQHFDLRVWIECSFETALQRATARSQEGLSTNETIRAYKNIYFPAQKIHFTNDLPQESADIFVDNNSVCSIVQE